MLLAILTHLFDIYKRPSVSSTESHTHTQNASMGDILILHHTVCNVFQSMSFLPRKSTLEIFSLNINFI